MDHTIYDKRRYPIVDVREGYAEWVRTYEQIVQDEMDLHLLDRLKTIDWSGLRLVLDLACGTGRIGQWLKQRCAARMDGIDLTPEMLEVARSKDVYRTLHVADVVSTGLPAQAYEVCMQSLADEHLPDLRPLCREVARVTKRGGSFVLVGFHPQFLMVGMPTHFTRASRRRHASNNRPSKLGASDPMPARARAARITCERVSTPIDSLGVRLAL